jgi:glycogen(starch) synthase
MEGRGVRVLMLTWEYPPRIIGGIARHVAGLSNALARQGAEVQVVTAPHPGAEPDEVAAGDPAGVAALGVYRSGDDPVAPVDFVAGIHQLGFGLLERALPLFKGRRKPDVVHGHDWLVAFPARTLKQAYGLPLVMTIHATEHGRNDGIHTPMQQYIHSIEGLATNEAARVICCSRFMADEVERVLACPADKVAVVPNGIEVARMALPPGATPADLARFRRGFAERDEQIVLYVGRMVREKGVAVLVEAMPRVLARRPGTRLVLAGQGETAALRDRAAALGLGDRVRFMGFVPDDDLRRLYAVADVAVYPSLYEPFGIVALEAMAARVPLVTSDVGGFREVVEHGVTGTTTWANNPESLAWGLLQCLEQPERARRLAEAAYQKVVRDYSWDRIAQRTLDVYEKARGRKET